MSTPQINENKGLGLSGPVVENSQFTGAALVTIPILVPPGRNGIAPKLSLTYNSFRKNGWLGVGWDIDMGSIQRSAKFGVCYDCDDYVANKSGSFSVLVPRTDWGPDYYGAKIEGAFSKYFKNPSGGWIVYAKDGLKYYYGTIAASRQDNTHGIFNWFLDKVEDTNGNFMEITYYKDQGQIYLDEIRYTGNGSLAPVNYIKFHLMDRDLWDAAPMYDTNSEVITAKLLKSIDVQANTDRVRAYEFSYAWNENSYRSVLAGIRQYGTDAQLDPDGVVTGGTALPSTDLTWFGGGEGTYNYQSSNASVGNKVLFADVNGDGLADLIKYTSSDTVYTYLSIGEGQYDPNYTVSNGPGDYVLFADVSGDGKADLIKHTSSGTVYTYLSIGGGQYDSNYTTTEGPGLYVLFADISGDGKADLIKNTSDGWVYTFLSKGDGTYENHKTLGGSGGHGSGMVMSAEVNSDGRADLIKLGEGGWVYTHLSNGDGTYGYVSATGGNGYSGPGYVHFADVNGDGRADMAKHDSDGWVFTFLSKGDGTYTNQIVTGGSGGNGNGYVGFADVNGDGRADLVKRDVDGWVYTFISNGSGAFIYHSRTGGSGGNGPNLVQFADVDGDGRADLIKLDPGGMVYTSLSNGDGPSDYLKTATSPYGAKTTMAYTPSSQYQNTLMPFILQTLSSKEVNDGFGNLSTTRYSYFGGLFDFATRQFRGFETETKTNPDSITGNPSGTIVQTKFHLDEYLQGSPNQVELKAPGANGDTLIKTDFDWETRYLDEPANTYAFAKLNSKRIGYYDHNVETAFRLQDYTYDIDVGDHPLPIAGNLISIRESGTDAEDVINEFEYTDQHGIWLWRKTRETLKNKSGATVRQTSYVYENGTGNLLSKEFILDTGPNPRIEMTYDPYGNQKTVKDAGGNITTTEYDTITYTFPIKNLYPQTGCGTPSGCIDHIVENQAWDYRFGKVTITKDENGNRTYYDYDTFGRPVQVDSPNGGQVTTEYTDDEFPRYVLTKVKEDASGNTIDTYQYVDGLGRDIQTITFGEAGKSIVTKKFYDALGRNDLTEGPFFSTDVAYPQHPLEACPWRQVSFDLRGRPETIESADGQYGSVVATFSYRGLAATATDPDGGSKTEKKDYLGRVIEVIEHADQDNLSTSYSYNAAGDLLEVIDHHNNKTTLNYDILGRKILMNDPDMGYWEYTYDANGNLLSQVDEKMQKVNFYYDELNRLTSKAYSTSDPTVTYRYDNLLIPNGRGRLYSVSTSQVTTTYNGYGEMGNVSSVSKSISGDSSAYTTQYAYDLSGKVTQTIYPDGYQVSHTYYAGTGLLQGVTGADAVAYAQLSNYEPSGKIRHIEHANGVFTNYTYDPESTRLTSIVTTRPGPTADLQNKVYKYTPAGDIKEISDDVKNVTYSYTYDKLHRLTAETSTGAYDPISYTYNAIGNLTSKTVGDTALTYKYDQWHKHAVKSVSLNGDDYTYNYDDNGNMIESPDFTNREQVAMRIITYNADNMPVRIHYENGKPASAQSSSSSQSSSPFSNLAACWIATVSSQGGAAWTVDFYYDGEGMRVKKVILGASATYYIGPHFEIKDSLATKYIFAGNLRIARVTETDTSYFHKDHLGSSTIMTDSMGEQVEATEYLPFGQMRNHSGEKVSDHKFTDQEFDAETGLYNYNARLYDPVIGRFISADTAIPYQLDPQSWNRYSYCRNNPLIYIDPTGNMDWAVERTSVGVSLFNIGVTQFEGTAYSMGRGPHGQYTAVDFEGLLWGGAAGAPADIAYSVDIFSDAKGEEIDPYGIQGFAGAASLGLWTPNAGDPSKSLSLGITILGDFVSSSDAFELVEGFTLGVKGQFGSVNIKGTPYSISNIDFMIEALAPQSDEANSVPNLYGGGYIDEILNKLWKIKRNANP
jgi:RHS repeat-associated protein